MSSGRQEMSVEGWGPYSGGDDLGAIVAEVGSYTTKMGYAGEDAPRSIFRTAVAALREKSGSGRIVKMNHGDWWHRQSMEKDGSDGRWEVVSPVDAATGLVYGAPGEADGGEDDDGGKGAHRIGAEAGSSSSVGGGGGGAGECYDLLLSHLRHGFASALPTVPSEHPLVLIEKSYDVPSVRQKSLEVLFEELDVPAAFLARDAVMACYAVGRSTGTVVDVGHAGTVVTPVYDGYVETRGIVRGPAGGLMTDRAVLENLDALHRERRARMKKKADPTVDPPGYVMPLYQVRARKLRTGTSGRRSSDAIHNEARLYVARTAKEFGIGAAVAGFGYAAAPPEGGEGEADGEGPVGEGVNAAATATIDAAAQVRQQYANAPKIPFDLPDGNKVEVSVMNRFDAAETMFGKDARSVRRREEATARARKRLDAVVAASAALAASADDGSTVAGTPNIDEDGAVGTTGANGLRSVKTKDARARRRRQLHSQVVRRAAPYLSNQIGELTSNALPAMVCDAAFKCDRDQQAQLLGNVVLCGGGACLGPNDSTFPDRLRDEVEAIIHTHTPGWRVKVLSPDRRERSYASWLGGSIMASIGTFHDFWITRKEYEEFGPAIVNRKCP